MKGEMMKIGQTEEKLKEATREALKDLLSQCTDAQVNFFNRMYKSIEEIPENKISWAMKQCERTININTNTTSHG